MKIRLFIKPYCGWCHKAIRWLDDHDIAYEKLDVIADEPMSYPSERKQLDKVNMRAVMRAPCLRHAKWVPPTPPPLMQDRCR